MESITNLLQAQLNSHIDTTMTLGEKAIIVFVLASTLGGALFLASKLFSFIRLILSLFILPGKPLRSFGPPSSWAIITGASDGLGKEFALQLSRTPFNLLLISRTQSKLDGLAQQIRSSNPAISVETLAFDFSTVAADDENATQRLRTAIAALDGDVAVLVNNVGKSHEIPVPFVDTEAEEMRDIINVNRQQSLPPAMVDSSRERVGTPRRDGGAGAELPRHERHE
ncbi:MAG: hypothetical protein Q9196_007502 [Gyalolechia fulgens]